jgi:hypothetical protein
LAGDSADNDGDGLANITEYLSGSDPYTYSPPVITAVDQTLQLRIDPDSAEVLYLLEVSENLTHWTQVTPSGAPQSWIKSYTAPAGSPRLFGRLRMARNY